MLDWHDPPREARHAKELRSRSAEAVIRLRARALSMRGVRGISVRTLKRLALSFTPPVILFQYEKVRRRPPPLTTSSSLFDGDDALFKQLVSKASCYGEYGVGLSTEWVMDSTEIPIIGVDSSHAWIEHVQLRYPGSTRLDLRFVDVGPVGDWGTPISYERRHHFPRYPRALWDLGISPDLVLIDDRFRVACLITSLLRGTPGVKIIFDDYVPRPRYHVVEELVKPLELTARQALFEVPPRVDRDVAQRMLSEFQMVLD